jgi:hypothetical protein
LTDLEGEIMKKILFFVFLAMAIVFLAGYSCPAEMINTDKNHYYARDHWQTKMPDGSTEQFWTHATNDPSVAQKLNSATGNVGKQNNSQAASPRPGVERRYPQQAASRAKRSPPTLSRDKERVVGGVKIVPRRVPAVPYHLERGDTISRNVRPYTTRDSTNKILQATGKTVEQAKKMRVGDAVLVPEKELRPEFRNPLPKLKALYAEREQLIAEINALRETGGTKDELINAHKAKLLERNAEILRLTSLLKERDKEIASLKNSSSPSPSTEQAPNSIPSPKVIPLPQQDQSVPDTNEAAPKAESKGEEFKGKYSNAVFTY